MFGLDMCREASLLSLSSCERSINRQCTLSLYLAYTFEDGKAQKQIDDHLNYLARWWRFDAFSAKHKANSANVELPTYAELF